jgi:hypothetical protein
VSLETSTLSGWVGATAAALQPLADTLAADVRASDTCMSETAAMLFWAVLAAGQITMRKVDGWETLNQSLADHPIDLAA